MKSFCWNWNSILVCASLISLFQNISVLKFVKGVEILCSSSIAMEIALALSVFGYIAEISAVQNVEPAGTVLLPIQSMISTTFVMTDSLLTTAGSRHLAMNLWRLERG